MRSPASIRRCLVECMMATFPISCRGVRMIHGSGARKDTPAGLRLASLAPRLFNHVIDNVSMLALRAEHNDLRVSTDTHIVPRWPVEQVIGTDCLLLAHRIGRGEFTTQHKAPMRTLTEVSFQTLEKRGGIHPRGKGEVLAADLAVSTCIAEFRALTDNGAGYLHLGIHLFLCNPT